MDEFNNMMTLDKKSNEDYENRRFLVMCVFLLVWFALFFLYHGYNFEYVEVSGASMEETLETGDVLTVNKRIKAGYGDIVIIDGEKISVKDPTKYELIIKRVIGLGGDKIEITGGKVYRNGTELTEPYAKGKTYGRNSSGSFVDTYEYIVPDGEVYYLGDNREASMDSRSSYGTCKAEQIKGVVPDWSVKVKGVTTWRMKFAERIRAALFGDA